LAVRAARFSSSALGSLLGALLALLLLAHAPQLVGVELTVPVGTCDRCGGPWMTATEPS